MILAFSIPNITNLLKSYENEAGVQFFETQIFIHHNAADRQCTVNHIAVVKGSQFYH